MPTPGEAGHPTPDTKLSRVFNKTGEFVRLEWGVSGQLLRAVQTGLSGCAAPAHTRPVAPRARLRQGARSKAPSGRGGQSGRLEIPLGAGSRRQWPRRHSGDLQGQQSGERTCPQAGLTGLTRGGPQREVPGTASPWHGTEAQHPENAREACTPKGSSRNATCPRKVTGSERLD